MVHKKCSSELVRSSSDGLRRSAAKSFKGSCVPFSFDFRCLWDCPETNDVRKDDAQRKKKVNE